MIIALLALTCTSALVVERHVSSANPWHLVTRFCFTAMPDYDSENRPGIVDDGEGEFNILVTFRKRDRISVSLFFDENNEWSDAYTKPASEMSCVERQNSATKTFNLWKSSGCSMLANPDDEDGEDGCSLLPFALDDDPNDNAQVTVKREFQFRGLTRKWFYVVISNCDPDCELTENLGSCTGHLDVAYKFEMLNSADRKGKVLDPQRQFSAEEYGVIHVTRTFFSFQLLNVIFMVIIRAKLIHRRKYHTTVFMLHMCTIISLVSQFLWLLNYEWFAEDGLKRNDMVLAARFVGAVYETLFVTLLLVLAKGWTIVRRKISAAGRIKITIFVTIYLFLLLLANIMDGMMYDPAVILYFYEAPWGQIVIFCRVCLAAWFINAARITSHNFEKKRGFYGKFNKFYLVWILSTPVAYWISTFLETYHRYLFMYATEATFTFLGQFVLIVLYNPSTQFNRSFPFHGNTNSMLGMHGPKGNKSESTALFTSDRQNRLSKDPNMNAIETSPAPAPRPTSHSNFTEQQGRDGVRSLSGGLGVQKSRSGQLLISNQFDAMHFLRIKAVSDSFKNQINEFVERVNTLDAVLDAVTIENAGQFGALGRSYSNSLAQKMKMESGPSRNEAAMSQQPPLNFVSKRVSRQQDWRNDIDAVSAKGDARVLEMAKRYSSRGGLENAIDKEIDMRKRERNSSLDKTKHPDSEGKDTSGRERDYERTDRSREGSQGSRDMRSTAKSNGEEERMHKSRRDEDPIPRMSSDRRGGPQRNPGSYNDNADGLLRNSRQRGEGLRSGDTSPAVNDDSDEFDRFEEVPKPKARAQAKSKSKRPPPGAPPSRTDSTLGSVGGNPSIEDPLGDAEIKGRRPSEEDAAVKKKSKKKKKNKSSRSSRDGDIEAKELPPVRQGSARDSEDDLL